MRNTRETFPAVMQVLQRCSFCKPLSCGYHDRLPRGTEMTCKLPKCGFFCRLVPGVVLFTSLLCGSGIPCEGMISLLPKMARQHVGRPSFPLYSWVVRVWIEHPHQGTLPNTCLKPLSSLAFSILPRKASDMSDASSRTQIASAKPVWGDPPNLAPR